MPLSLIKLQQYLTSKGYVPNKYFVMDGMCFFIELFNTRNADLFLLYLPSKYNFEMKEGENVYVMSYLELPKVDPYMEEKKEDIANKYDKVQLPIEKGKIEEALTGNYKKPIELSDTPANDMLELHTINRQLGRLKFCVQSIKYKLAIGVKNYIGAIRRDDSINFFTIKNFPRDVSKKLYVVSDLEVLYEKGELMADDISTVRDSVYAIVEKNQTSHSSMVEKLMSSKMEFSNVPIYIDRKKQEYQKLIDVAEGMLKTLSENERLLQEKLSDIETEMRANTSIVNDTNFVHRKTEVNNSLNKIAQNKGEIAKNIMMLRQKRENALLLIDEVMYDNVVMMDKMLQNFGKLKIFT